MQDISIQNIKKSYSGNTALNDVTLTLENGTMTAVLGPSGCGKTTMLRLLAGFLKPDEGAIKFGETDVTELAPGKRGATLVFQNYALWPHLSVFDNIAYGLKMKKVPKHEIKERVEKITELVGLDQQMLEKGRKPAQLSGGQQQRVALARALVVEPPLFLLDEPLSNLDAKVRSKLRVYIREIQQKVGITALYVTHDQEEALSIADKVVVMNKGQIMQIGAPEEIYSKPANLFMAEFIGDSKVLNGNVSDENVSFLGMSVKGLNISVDSSMDVEKGCNAKVIIRASEVKLLEGHAKSEEDGNLYIPAFAKSSMYEGSKHKHVVQMGEETIFADWEIDLTGQEVTVVVPKSKVIVFKK